MNPKTKNNPKWLKLYSLVLIANGLYIVAFYLIMKAL